MAVNIEEQTQSVCPVCLRRVDAAYVREGNSVFLQKTCPQHGNFRVPAWVEPAGAPRFAVWRQGARIPAYPARPATPMAQGCPYDCGLCPDHAQHTCTGLVEVTQRCSLRCPVCYARTAETPAAAAGPTAQAELSAAGEARLAQEQTGDPALSVIAAQLDVLFAASGACNVQLSGGEPTERDDLPEIIRMAKARGFGLVQVNSNGMRLGREAGYAARLKAAGLDSVYLQFDGVEDSAFRALRGRDCLAVKQAALAACAAAGLGVVLVCTLARGVNDGMVGALLRWAVAQGKHVRGLHFQPVSSFGRFPWEMDAAPRVTLPELMTALEVQSGGMVRAAHFHAPSCEHPLCSFSAVYGRTAQGLSAEPLGAACCSGGTGLVPRTAEEKNAPPRGSAAGMLAGQQPQSVSAGQVNDESACGQRDNGTHTSAEPATSGRSSAGLVKGSGVSVGRQDGQALLIDNAEGARKAKAFVAHHWNSPSAEVTPVARAGQGADESASAEPAAGGHAGAGRQDGQTFFIDNAEGARKAKAFVAHQRPEACAAAPAAAPADDDFSRFLARSGADNRFTVSAMAFQDALSLDIARVRGCCIHVVTQDGRLVPFCAYNLTSCDGTALYRGREMPASGAASAAAPKKLPDDAPAMARKTVEADV